MKVGILGKAGSGKDTIADYLVENYNFAKIAFADPIKRFAKEIMDFNSKQLWGPSEFRNAIDERYGIPPRLFLQKVGTEGARSVYENVWVDYAIKVSNKILEKGLLYNKEIGAYNPNSIYQNTTEQSYHNGVVISDCRFRNECSSLKDNGFLLIKVIRPGAGLEGDYAKHESELEQENIPDSLFDKIIYNDQSLEYLYDNVDKLIEHTGLFSRRSIEQIFSSVLE